MKIFIFSLSCTFLLSCVTVAASKQTQSGQNADHAPGIATINTGTDKTTLNALRRKVQKLEDTPALQTKPHQLQCGNTQYTNFQAMKNDLKVMEAEKSHIIGMTLGGACALTHEALKLLSDQNS